MTTEHNTTKDKSHLPVHANGASAANETKSPPAMPDDAPTLTDEQLAARIANDQAEIARRLEERRSAALAALREQAEVAQALGIPLARLKAHLDRKDDGMSTAATGWKAADGSNIGARAVVAPKYRSKTNPELAWSGRGKPPKWFSDAIANGITEDAMRIPEGADLTPDPRP